MIRDPESVLDRLGRTLAHKAGVKVVIGGEQACTDGRVIMLPSLPVDLDESEWRATNGLLDHEASHVIYTDFTALPPDPLTAQALNTIEDFRVEGLYCRRYPGSLRNLAVAHAKALSHLESVALPEHAQCLIGLLCRLQNLPLPTSAGAAARQWADKWAHIKAKVAAAPSTGDLVPLAEALAKDLPCPPSQPTSSQSPMSEAMEKLVTGYAQRAGKRATKIVGPHLAQEYDASPLRKTTQRLVPGLARRLEQSVLAAGLSRWVPDQERGRIAQRQLHRLACRSSERIFKKLERGIRRKTAVSLVLDASSSMQSLIETATASVAVTAQALLRLQVSTEVLAFAGPHVVLAKAFHEQESVLLPRLAGVRANGGTPLADVVLVAAKRLAVQRADRHVLIAASDGEPDDKNYALDMIKRAESVGIEVLGLGIAHDLSHMFPDHVYVPNISEMAKALMLRLRPLLLKGVS